MTKLFHFLLVYILSLINFVMMLVPLFILSLPILYLTGQKGASIWMSVIGGSAFCVSAFMVIYLLLDMIFGFTVKHYTRTTLPINKAGFLEGQRELVEYFEYIKTRFNMPSVELFISQDLTSNAYAVGSMRKKAVIITMGLIQRFYDQSPNKDQFLISLAGVMAHEMSHLANKDFLPGMLIYSNEIAQRFLSKIFRGFIILFIFLIRIIPYLGKLVSFFLMQIYNLVESVMGIFFRLIFMPLHHFISKWLSRSIEYRCDKDAASLFGGKNMALALSMLGKGAYFSIFSTHPRTKARIVHVQKVHIREGVIRPSLLTKGVNLAALTILLAFTYYLSLFIDLKFLYEQILVSIIDKLQHMVELAKGWIFQNSGR